MTEHGSSEPSDSSRGRVESDLELLDDDAPLIGPLPGLKLYRRFPKALRILGFLLVAALGATWGASMTHTADVHDRSTAERDKIVLRLLGGTGNLAGGFDPGDPSAQLAKVGTVLHFTIRNDGVVPVTIDTASIDQPAVTALLVTDHLTAPPGKRVVLVFQLTVNCTRANLPERPDAVHLTAQSPDGHVTKLTIPIPVPTTPAPTPTATATASAAAAAVSDPTDGRPRSYFDLCGMAGAAANAKATYQGLVAQATPADPQFGYKMDVHLMEATPRLLAQSGSGTGLPGLTVATDLPGRVVVAAGETKTVVVTYRVTDCAALEKALSASNVLGGTNLLGRPVLVISQTDPRFSRYEQEISDYNSSDLYIDFLHQLGNACPSLQ